MSAFEHIVENAIAHGAGQESQQPSTPSSPRPTQRERSSPKHATSRKQSTSGRMPSTSLDVDFGEPVDDPEAPNFVRNSSAFRGPLEAGAGTPPRTPRSRRRSSYVGGANSDNEGFFRRWVEEPLGLVSDGDEHTKSRPESSHDAPEAGPSAPPRVNGDTTPKQSATAESSPRNSKPVTWDASVRTKLGLRRRTSSAQPPRESEAIDAGNEADGEANSPADGRPAPNRLASRRWAIIKNRLAPAHGNTRGVGPSAAVSPDVNISDELLGGGLATLMLKMHFDRDEQNRRRVPVLLHHLKIRVSDSIHPLKGTHTVFRIECEYVNGAARWVIYRELRDFITLHTHYRVAKVYGRGNFDLPEFPLTSLPYFKFLKSQDPNTSHEERKAAFARLQRLHLENYLLALIKSVMFRPEANRLSKFFEISALSISLAKSGGYQGKAGILRVIGSQTSRRSVHSGLSIFGLGEAAKPRWWIVRESYMVAVDDPGDTEIYDVFIFDRDFAIERPKRYYRKLDPFQLVDGSDSSDSDSDQENPAHQIPDPNQDAAHSKGTLSRISEKLHLSKHKHHRRRSSDTTNAAQEKHDNLPANGAEHGEQPAQPTTLDRQADEAIEDSHNARSFQGGKKSGKGKNIDVSQHTFHIQNSQRRLKLVAKNERQLHQWITSIERMAQKSHWTSGNRFDSFAPIRLNVAAQWLVDGRDYFWNLSRAISLAKHTIYIHDWWLSPELQMRRPGKNQYRVDNLLKRKAEEGVKIFVIVYKEVSNRTTPTDSNYTKQRLVALHPNIMVQRSPGHYATGTFFWAHHEKLCVIDEAIAFMGGLDMCFGRWDTPQHALVDDPDDEDQKIWVGKDYSNERVLEFHTLNKPFEDMYDRGKVPRMPWHDVSLQILGQPARDLCRHFVQRWNYLLRIKTHSRIMPFLLPPSDFRIPDLDDRGLSGTCEVQITRSAGNWSMGFQNRAEHSIQNAYLKAIQMSEHFVYIENQFFITSTVVSDVKIENQIGDALVSRIIRAHHEGTAWRACIVIPLLPGFTFPIDHSDASAVRIILECQNRTIGRGPNSIFARLRKEGIDPNEYISFFSLRQWGKLRGGALTTEQLYIHGKIMIVDDRLAIIGSANINERSQRGDRDSELASIIRDTDMIDSTMADKPFKVGRFAHTLRIRLMREHLGVDVDKMYTEDLLSKSPTHKAMDVKTWDPDHEEGPGYDPHGYEKPKKLRTGFFGNAEEEAKGPIEQMVHGLDDDVTGDTAKLSKKLGINRSDMDSRANDATLEGERRMVDRKGREVEGFASSIVPTIEEQTVLDRRPTKSEGPDKPIKDELDAGKGQGGVNGTVQGSSGNTSSDDVGSTNGGPPESRVQDGSKQLYGAPAQASKSPREDDEPPHAGGAPDADDVEKAAIPARKILRQHLSVKVGHKPWTTPTPRPEIDPHNFDDPVSDKFYKNVWLASATHNTEIFRKVFHCTPDDLVTTWKQYKEFVQHQERMAKGPKERDGSSRPEPAARMPSEGVTNAAEEGKDAAPTEVGESNDRDPDPDHQNEARAQGTHEGTRSPQPNGNSTASVNRDRAPSNLSVDDRERDRPSMSRERLSEHMDRGPSTAGSSKTRRPTHLGEPIEQWELDEMEELLQDLCGTLVIYPTRFLEGEDASNNFLFNADRLLPLPIYD